MSNGSIEAENEKLQKHVDKLVSSLKDLTRTKYSYLNTLALISATIASFSLLALQTSTDVDKKFLFWSFSLLVANTAVAIFFMTINIWFQNKAHDIHIKQIDSWSNELEKKIEERRKELGFKDHSVTTKTKKAFKPWEIAATLTEKCSLAIPILLFAGIGLLIWSIKRNLF